MKSLRSDMLLYLYGTEEPPSEECSLKAGSMSALFDGANLRDIRMHGEEVLRAISFVVRDRNWATLVPDISDLQVIEQDDHFSVSYHATVKNQSETFEFDVEIEGDACGVLTFSGRGESQTGLLTNRTGFVVLHPIKGVSGAKADVTHCDGRVVQTHFPTSIKPIQPMLDMREIVYETQRGQRVSCVMEGDSFEMEDQRNWTDASFKTYVRPLSLPWPYKLEPGEIIDQKISVTISGVPTHAKEPNNDVLTICLGDIVANVPNLGVGLQPEEADAVLLNAARLRQLGVSHVICNYDPRRGDRLETLTKQVAACHAIGAEPWLEAVIESIDDTGAAEEITELGKKNGMLGDPFTTVMVSPASDLKCTLPGSIWPSAPNAEKLYIATRDAFPKAIIGGGMFSFFTELNRKRPPVDTLDVITFTTAAIFHAGDDRSMMETLECLPHIVSTLPEITKGVPFSVGPSAIGLRDNPYGDAPVSNPQNIRQAANYNDPRQRGIIGAAWNLGYIAEFALGGAHAITLGGLVGPFGVISVPTTFPQPGFEGKGELYPIWHVIRGMARLVGNPIRPLSTVGTNAVRGFAVETSDSIELWMCNSSPVPITVSLPDDFVLIALLNSSTFIEAIRQFDMLDKMQLYATSTIVLDAYAVMRARKMKSFDDVDAPQRL